MPRISITSLIAALDAQQRRLEKLRTASDPIITDYFITDLQGQVLKGEAREGSIKVCLIPCGKYLDKDRMELKEGCFRLPAIDAQAAVMEAPAWAKEPPPLKPKIAAATTFRNPIPVAKDPEYWTPTDDELAVAKAEAEKMHEEMSAIPGVTKKRLNQVMREAWNWL